MPQFKIMDDEEIVNGLKPLWADWVSQSDLKNVLEEHHITATAEQKHTLFPVYDWGEVPCTKHNYSCIRRYCPKCWDFLEVEGG